MTETARYTLMREDVACVAAREYGDTRDSTTILAALLDIGARVCTLLLTADDDGVWTLTAPVTIPANVTLCVPTGVTMAGSATLTLLGGLVAFSSAWFQSTGMLLWDSPAQALTAAWLHAQTLTVDGPLRLGTTTSTVPGTLRWTGTDFEGRTGSAWVSLTAIDPTLQALAALTGSPNTLSYFTGTDVAALSPLTPFARTLIGDPDAATMRGTLGVPATGAVQPVDATLSALAGLATGADQLPYATGTDTFAQTPLTAFARTLLDDTTQAAMRTTLALTPGTDVQAQDAELQALAGLTSAADRLPYFTGSGTAALATFTAAGRNLVDDADATAQRTTLGLGTMSTQNANAVAITGGAFQGASVVASAGYFSTLGVNVTPTGSDVLAINGSVQQFGGTMHLSAMTTTGDIIAGGLVQAQGFFSPQNAVDNAVAFYTTQNAGGANRWAVNAQGTAPSYFGGNVQVAAGQSLLLGTPTALFGARAEIVYTATAAALGFRPTTDASPYACYFTNASGGTVGSIQTTATATAYNTTSDTRLKHAITALAGALDVVRALRPVAFRWQADQSPGHGFLAHELQQVLPEAVTGEPAAVNADGSIKPQQVDHSKITVWLVGAVQELAQQVEALQARVASLEEQLGLFDVLPPLK